MSEQLKQKEPKLLNNGKYQTVPVETLDRLYASEKELKEIKQKEQKKEFHIPSYLGIAHYNPAPIEQKEQKPKNILTDDDSLQTAYLKGQTDVLEDPEAYGLQKEPAEWSDEDTLMLTAIIQTLERFGGRGTTVMQIDWLKDLRPAWKPTEEQMDSLRDTIVQTKGYSYSVYLPELYEQLKKLLYDKRRNHSHNPKRD